ncbi:MAG: TetR/AcrR family transcriptional regulator [Lachnospiraceae bacterium]|nr:TetR/AcrR family transcriptional regulator [Lachnospiraceae bacterium]
MLQKLTEEKLREILEKGSKEFAEKGFERASMKNIAKSAGISVGVLYKYYENKDDFFDACLEDSLKVLSEKMEEFNSWDITPRDRIERLLHLVLEFSRENPDAVRMYHEITSSSFTEKARKLATHIESISAKTYRDYMTALKEADLLKEDIIPEAAAFFFDNCLMMLQFSYNVDYFDERKKLYLGSVYDNDDVLIKQMMLMLDGALLRRD